jgi:hypothetical protein
MELKRFHRSEPNIYAIAAGFLAVSTVFAGLFLWGLGKQKVKKKILFPFFSSVSKVAEFSNTF